MDSDPSLGLAACVQERRLEADRLHIRQTLLVSDLHAKPRVGIYVRQRQQISGPDEEIAVECMNAQASSAPHPHHRLEADLSRQVAHEDTLELHDLLLLADVEEREVMHGATAELADASCGKFKRSAQGYGEKWFATHKVSPNRCIDY